MGKLHFNSAALNLLDNLPITAFIIKDGLLYYCNGDSAETAAGSFMPDFEKSDQLRSHKEETAINVRDRVIHAELLHNEKTEYMTMGITLNNSPGKLVLSKLNCSGLSLRDCISFANNDRGIQRILLVDDNPIIVETYQSILQSLGYETLQHTNPATALEAAATETFDLLISDFEMPVMNGIELFQKLYDSRPGLPVMIISGSAQIKKGSRLLCGDYMVYMLNKPVTLVEFRRSLEVMEFIYKLCRFSRSG